MTRIITRIGDVFEVMIDEHTKKYFQYIANDWIQLNSPVIRGFKQSYAANETPEIEFIVNDEVAFYAHAILRTGIKLDFWKKIGKDINIGATKDILFRDSDEYGAKHGEQSVKVSHSWYVWRINDKNFTYIGELTGENQKAYIGLIINPLGIIELLKGNKYPTQYPDFE